MNAAASNLSQEWFQLAPIGEHPHSGEDGKTRVQVIDASAVQAMANSFRPKVLVDQEHFSYDADKSSEAYGWLVEVQPRTDGLYGSIEWTDSGERAVANARYRFLSPVWLPRDLEKLGGNRVRPLRLDSLGLTNTPNLKTINPLLNRADGPCVAMTQRKPRPQMIANRAMPTVLANRGVMKITDVINDLKRVTGRSFESLWQSSQPFFNRFSTEYGAIDGNALWQNALAIEQQAFDKSFDFQDRSESEDRGSRLYKGITQPTDEFMKAMQVEMSKGKTFEQAWDYLKQTEPVFFLRHVWAMTDPVGGRGW